MTSDNDTEIMESVNLVLSASRLGLVHESINVNRIMDYTRKYFPASCLSLGNKLANIQTGSWFAWANSVFAQTILDLAKRKPYLIFGPGSKPYIIE